MANSTLPSASKWRGPHNWAGRGGLGLDQAFGDLFVGDLGAAGEQVTSPMRSAKADESRAGCRLGDGEEGAGVLGPTAWFLSSSLSGSSAVASPALISMTVARMAGEDVVITSDRVEVVLRRTRDS